MGRGGRNWLLPTFLTHTSAKAWRKVRSIREDVDGELRYDATMKFRIDTDTSVLGGCEDEEFAEYSIRLMESFVRGERVLVLSSLAVQELAAAPITVRRRLASVPEANIETLPLDAEATELAEASIATGVITGKMRADAQQIAIATVARVDVLVSWNFKHIVNLQRIHGDNSVNLRQGYPMIEIRTPREVLSDESVHEEVGRGRDDAICPGQDFGRDRRPDAGGRVEVAGLAKSARSVVEAAARSHCPTRCSSSSGPAFGRPLIGKGFPGDIAAIQRDARERQDASLHPSGEVGPMGSG